MLVDKTIDKFLSESNKYKNYWKNGSDSESALQHWYLISLKSSFPMLFFKYRTFNNFPYSFEKRSSFLYIFFKNSHTKEDNSKFYV